MNDGWGLSEALHGSCVVCSPRNSRGLGVTFTLEPDRSCTGIFACDASFQGYNGLVHGGVVAALLDGAMANCLLHQHRVAHTGQFSMRFRHPVLVGQSATVRARVVRSRRPIHVLSAELAQDGRVKVTASATFVDDRASAGTLNLEAPPEENS